jgi:hypothetical protein
MLNAKLHLLGKVVLALAILLLSADSALAYVGPGADLVFLQQAWVLLMFALTATSAVLLWPVYAILRRFRKPKRPPEPEPAASDKVAEE